MHRSLASSRASRFVARFSIIAVFTALLVSIQGLNPAHACELRGNGDATLIGTAPNGCFIGRITVEKVEMSPGEIETGALEVFSTYTVEVTVSADIDLQVTGVNVLFKPMGDTSNSFASESGNICAYAAAFEAPTLRRFEPRTEVVGDRRLYTYRIEQFLNHKCWPGEYYHIIQVQLPSGTHPFIARSIPSNRLKVVAGQPAPGVGCWKLNGRATDGTGQSLLCQWLKAPPAPPNLPLASDDDVRMVWKQQVKYTNEKPGARCLKSQVGKVVTTRSGALTCTKTSATKYVWKAPTSSKPQSSQDQAAAFLRTGCDAFKRAATLPAVKNFNELGRMTTDFGMAARLDGSKSALSLAATVLYRELTRAGGSLANVRPQLAIINAACKANVTRL